MRLSMPLFKQAAERLFEPALRNVEYFQRRLSAFAIFAFFMFPLYYVVWHTLFPRKQRVPNHVVKREHEKSKDCERTQSPLEVLHIAQCWLK